MVKLPGAVTQSGYVIQYLTEYFCGFVEDAGQPLAQFTKDKDEARMFPTLGSAERLLTRYKGCGYGLSGREVVNYLER